MSASTVEPNGQQRSTSFGELLLSHHLAADRTQEGLAEHEGVGLIVFGHDAEQWANLRKVPEYYD